MSAIIIANIPTPIGLAPELISWPYGATEWVFLNGATIYGSSDTPNGWDAVWNTAPTNATITAPSSAVGGEYGLRFKSGGGTYTVNFNVICMAVTIATVLSLDPETGNAATGASAVVEGGTPDFTYSWELSDVTGTLTLDNDDTESVLVGGNGHGTLTVTVSDSDGCSATASTDVSAIEADGSLCPVLSPLSLTYLDSEEDSGLLREIRFQVDAAGVIPDQGDYGAYAPSWTVSSGVTIIGTPSYTVTEAAEGATYVAQLICSYLASESDGSKTATFHLIGESPLDESCNTTRSIALAYTCPVLTASIEATLIVPSGGSGTATYDMVAVVKNSAGEVVSGDYKYTWATALGADFASGGTLSESAARLVLPAGAGDSVSVEVQTPTPCKYSAVVFLTASTSEIPGPGSSGKVVTTALVEDLGAGDYRVTAQLTFAQSLLPTVKFIRGGVVVTDAQPLSYSFHLAGGESAELMLLVQDGIYFDTVRVTVENEDGPFAENPSSGDDDCVSSIGVHYRDFISTDIADGLIFSKGHFGVQNNALCPNPACRSWVQMFYSTDPALYQVYTQEATDAHQPLFPQLGANYSASGARKARAQCNAHATLIPSGSHLHMRLVSTPIFDLRSLSTGCEKIVKIRDNGDGTFLVFGLNPAKVFRYTPPVQTALGADRAGTLQLLVDLSALEPDAGDAVDAALAGDKIYVTRPGEMFVYDTDSGQLALAGGIRGAGEASFLENLNGKLLAIYVNTSSKCYDISFSPPRLLWTSSKVFTRAQVADGKLLLAADDELYVSATGAETPVLQPFSSGDDEFPDTITALATGYVGLDSGHVYRKLSTGWTDETTLVGPVGALWPWLGGLTTERALAGAASGTGAHTLKAEFPDLSWKADRTLDGAVTGITAMRALSDNAMLIGTGVAGLLWYYGLSFLSEEDGAFQSCHTIAQRVVGVRRGSG